MISSPTGLAGNALHAPYITGWNFTFAQLANASEFTTLFDQYMISHIQVRWYMKVDPSAQSPGIATFPKLYTITDHDDSDAPPALNNFREHSKCRVHVLNPNRAVVVNLKPAVLNNTYVSGVSNGYSPKWRQWIDGANTNVPHYGIKWAIDDFTNTNYRLENEIIYWFACKTLR